MVLLCRWEPGQAGLVPTGTFPERPETLHNPDQDSPYRGGQLRTVQNFTKIANRALGSSLRRSGQKPVFAATQVNPGVGDSTGPGTNVVLPTRDAATGLGIVPVDVLSPGVNPPRPDQ